MTYFKTLFSFFTVVFVSIALTLTAQTKYQNDPDIALPGNNAKQSQKIPSKSPSWKQFEQEYSSWSANVNPVTGLPAYAFGEPITVSGNTPQAKAQNFIREDLQNFQVDHNALQLLNNRQTSKFHYLNFKQYHHSLEVLNSKVAIRINKQGKVAMFGLDYYNDIEVSLQPSIKEKTAKINAARGISRNPDKIEVNPDLKVLPIQQKSEISHHLVYEVNVAIKGSQGKMPAHYYTLVDAHSGALLYRQNQVNTADPEATVKATITDQYPGNGQKTVNLPNLKLEAFGQTYHTDSAGHVTISNNGSVNATFYLEGKYAKVFENDQAIPSFTTTLQEGSNQVSFDNQTQIEELSAYKHVNTVHDFMKQWWPNFTGLDQPINVNVGVTSNSCNAFYSSQDNSVNFYQEDQSCNNFARVADIVYHEYGHAINNEFYKAQGANFNNGALNEGFADVWAFAITERAILGEGINKNGSGGFIRRYDRNPKKYPQDISGEVHNDGEIIAGALWELHKNLNSMDSLFNLFSQAYNGLPNGMDGQEGQVYQEVLIEMLLADDNDGNLDNGTPHMQEILNAFGKHGINLLISAELQHGNDKLVEANQPVTINGVLNGANANYIDDLFLHYNTDTTDQWNKVKLSKQGNVYTHDIPKQDTGSVISYYFSLEQVQGNASRTFPAGVENSNDPALPYFSLAGYEPVFVEKFNNDTIGWQINNSSSLTSGGWSIGEPIPSYRGQAGNEQVQPGSDNTPNGINRCAFTENAPSPNASQGDSDIDEGTTTLASPKMDFSNYDDPVISYYRWFTNNTGANPGNDPFEAYISDNNGNTWEEVEFTYNSKREWTQNAFRVKNKVELTPHVKFKIVASDRITNGENEGQSLTEAAFDDFFVYEPISSTSNVDTSSDNDTAITSTSIKKRSSKIKFYPNPTRGAFHVTLPEEASSSNAEIAINNLQGKTIYQSPLGQSRLTMNFKSLNIQPGIYLISIKTDKQVYRQKVLYQKD